MHTFVSLLRGINVGGHHLIGMPALKAFYESLGFVDVTTYIQSGNVIFRATAGDTSSVELLIEKSLVHTFGFPVTVIVRSPSHLGKVIKNNPYVARGGVDSSRLAVAFLKSQPAPALIKAMAVFAAKSTNEYTAVSGVVYLHCPDGFGKTLLTTGFFEKHLKVKATARNWKTTNALFALCANQDK